MIEFFVGAVISGVMVYQHQEIRKLQEAAESHQEWIGMATKTLMDLKGLPAPFEPTEPGHGNYT